MRAVQRLLLASLPVATLLAACGDNLDTVPGDDSPAPDATLPGDPDAGVDASVDAGSPVVPDPAVGTWRAGFALPGASGMGARVEAFAKGEDGIYAGGIFVELAGVRARNVARWTGTTWAPLGAGVPGWVTAMAFDGAGNLWVAGALFESALEENRLARWDGNDWTFVDGDIDGRVEDLAVLPDGSVAIAGNFATIGGIATGSLAVHDESGWRAIGPVGFDGASALLVHDGDLCVAGSFETIGATPVENAACWDGKAWTALGTGLPGGADVIAVGPDGRFYVGGTLTFADFDTGTFYFGLAALGNDDVWRPFAGGVDQGFITEVRGLAWRGDAMYVSGDFQLVNGDAPVAASRLARHDASGWKAIGDGLDNRIGVYLGNLFGGHDLLVDGETLWVGGVFSVADGAGATNVATLDTDEVLAPVVPAGTTVLGTSGYPDALAADAQGRIIAGGDFTHAGTVAARNVARLGPAGWEALGAGFNDAVLALHVRADGTIVAGGVFTASGATETVALAAWNGSAWGPLGGASFDGMVRAIAEDDAGNLYVGGAFRHVGTVPANGVARWDGKAWTAVGAGFDGIVYALTWADGTLVAGGEFAASGTTETRGIARWSGKAWVEVGGGLDGEFDAVDTLAAVDGGFLVGGQFTVADGSIPDLARWTGTAWAAVGTPLGDANDVARVTIVRPYAGGVFAAGTFDRTGDLGLGHLAWFDGTAWHGLGGGLDDLATDLIVVGTTLWVGGPQIEVGGRVSSGIAAWDFPALP